MIYSKFQKQLKQGQRYEKEILKYLPHDTYHIKDGYFKDYDVELYKDNIKSTVEVKSDRQAPLTGNMAIECEYNNQPSGITSTKADYFVYFVVHKDRDECYCFPTEELREICKTSRKVSGGDGGRSKMYLVKISDCGKYRKYKNN